MKARQIIKKCSHWEYILGVFLGILWLGLAMHGAWRKAPTVDEFPHIGDGLAVWYYGDYRMNPEHPPLLKLMATLPVMMCLSPDLTVERQGQELAPWVEGKAAHWGYYILYQNGSDPRVLVFLARIVPIFIGLLGGIVAWMWGNEFSGRKAGFFAFTTLLFYPEYLGHARFLTFDVSCLVACGFISYLAWSYWKRPGWIRGTVFAIIVGILALVKLPVIVYSIFLWLIILVILAIRYIKPELRIKKAITTGLTFKKYILLSLLLILCGYFFQWAGAGFRFDLTSQVSPMDSPHRLLVLEDFPEGALASIILFCHQYHLLPEASLAVLSHIFTTGGRHMFLFGELSFDGWFYYFLVTILLKTPLNYLIMFCGMMPFYIGKMRRGHGLEKERLLVLVVPFLMLLFLNMQSRLNIGHRHVLYIYFPWCVLLGVFFSYISTRNILGRCISCIIPCALVILCLVHHPHQATFFNILGGGSPRGGWKYLRDSNIDWGQDLLIVGEKLQEVGYDHVNLAYFGGARPQAYGINDYNFILPGYSHTIYIPEAKSPDPTWPTVVSLHVLDDVRVLYPGRFDREPEFVCNSIIIFAAEQNQAPQEETP
jgi:hypothetical protein